MIYFFFLYLRNQKLKVMLKKKSRVMFIFVEARIVEGVMLVKQKVTFVLLQMEKRELC